MKPITRPQYIRPARASMFELRMRRAERKIQIGNVVIWIGFAAFVALILAVIDLLLHPTL